MKTMFGVLAGAILAFLCISGLELLSQLIYPPPPGFDLADPADLARLMHVMPAAALVLVALGWFVGALAGAWAADSIARSGRAGWIVALLVLAGAVLNMAMIPHPWWMWAAGIALPLAAGQLARRLAKVAF